MHGGVPQCHIRVSLLFSLVFYYCFLLSLAFLFSPVNGKTSTCVTQPTGIVSWWPAEGNGDDTSDSNDGTIQGASFASGKVGQSFSLDGTDDYIGILDASNLDGQSELSLEAWINPDSLGWPNPDPDSNFQAAIITKYDSTQSIRRSYNFALTDGYLEMAVFGTLGELRAVSNEQVDIGVWTHVAGV